MQLNWAIWGNGTIWGQTCAIGTLIHQFIIAYKGYISIEQTIHTHPQGCGYPKCLDYVFQVTALLLSCDLLEITLIT